MTDKTYALNLNKNYYVVTANDLIKGKQKMTLRETKILLVAMSQVVKEDKDFKTYKTTIPELAKFLDVDANSLYRDIEEICSELMKRVVQIKFGGNKREWKMFHWVETAYYDGDCKLTLKLSEEIKPYILELFNHYTQYQLSAVLNFSSYYTTRLFQLLQCERGETMEKKEEWTFTIEQIRDFFQTESKYERTANLLNNTIVPAVKELNEVSDMYIFDYTEKRVKAKGNPIESVSFKVLFFDSSDEKQIGVNKFLQLQRAE